MTGRTWGGGIFRPRDMRRWYVCKGKNAKKQPPSVDLGQSVSERENSKSQGPNVETNLVVQATERMPKWLEHSEQGKNKRR